MSEWLERVGGIDVFTPQKPGRGKRGFRVFKHTPDYTGKECLVIHSFYINEDGKVKRHGYKRKAQDGKYVHNYYMVSIPRDSALDVARAIEKVMGETVPDEDTKDLEKDIEQYC